MVRKYIGIFIVGFFLLNVCMPLTSAGSFDVSVKPSDLEIGDVWLYNASILSSDGSQSEMMLIASVDSTKNAEIEGETYDSYVMNLGMNIEEFIIPNMMGISFDLVDGSYTGYYYFPKNYNLSKSVIQGKVKLDASFSEGEQTYNIAFSIDGKTTIIESTISNDEPENISADSTWTVVDNVIEIEKLTTNTSVMGETNTTITNKIKEKNETGYYECLGIETVDLDIGSFNAYKIKITYENSTNYTIRYTSSEVKNRLKEIKYDANGTVLESYHLISYDLATESNQDLDMDILLDNQVVEPGEDFDVTLKDESGNVINSAIVYIENDLQPTYTDENGIVTLSAPSEEKIYNIIAKKEGYKVTTQSFQVQTSSDIDNNTTKDKEKDDKSWIPGFELLGLIIAIISLIVIDRYKKNKRK